MSITPEPEDYDLDDGATEVVESRPLRRGPAPIDSTKITRSPSGGGVARLLAGGDSHLREFIILRKAGKSPAKIALSHAHIFKVLWQAWEAKRVNGDEDPGVSVAEVSALLDERGAPLATSSISATLRSLIRNEVVRSIDSYVGWRGRRTRYYPTDAGVQAFAMAETLGEGSFVQVGRTAKAWRSRDEGEPSNLFQHASMLRGWLEPVESV